MGHDVHVLCASAPSAAIEVAGDGVSVHRVGDWLLNAKMQVTPGAAFAKAAGVRRPYAGIRSLLRRAVRAIWRAIRWPDYACGWIFPAAWAARGLCAADRYDWIISVSHPFSGHVVGLLTKYCAPDSKWFVDIGDPFCLMTEPAPNNRRFYGWLNLVIERQVVTKGDAISVTTVSAQDLYVASFSLNTDKITVIPPLLSLPPLPAPSPRCGSEPIRLVFVGTLYRNLRSPRFLLMCFEALLEALPARSLELHFYGAVNDCAGDFEACPESVRSHIFVHGLVTRHDVLQAMVDADLLVNIGNDSESQLASKVIEYIAVGKPILNLVSISRDTSVEALADYPAVLTLARKEEGPSLATIDSLCSFLLDPPRSDHAVVDSVTQRHSLARVTALYASILERSMV